jgi:hypothetical protein
VKPHLLRARSALVLFLASLVIAAAEACGGAQAPASQAGDVCPVLDAGPPPTCPEGCTWDGAECRRVEGIVIHYLTTDGGRPRPR